MNQTSQTIALPYGKGHIDVTIPAANLQCVMHSSLSSFQPPMSQGALVEEALAHPHGGPRLRDRVRGKKNIVVISSDHTRPVPSRLLMTLSDQCALDNTVIMFISYSELFKDHVLCSKPGVAVFKNLASLMSAQYFRLEKKLRYMSIPSLRDRIIEFLIDCASANAASDYTFSVPFDREGMAQYLNVNRSALSRELSKMKKEHIIDYNKNSFRFLGDFFLGDF